MLCSFLYATIATIGSALGGIFGYAIGKFGGRPALFFLFRKQYKKIKDIEKKSKQVLIKLADKGIKVAKQSAENDSHHFDKMVIFKKEWGNGYLCMIGANNNLGGLHTQWYDSEGNFHTETISPILALEYGTAGLAISGGFDDGKHGGKGSAAVTFNHIDSISWYYYENAKNLAEIYQ